MRPPHVFQGLTEKALTVEELEGGIPFCETNSKNPRRPARLVVPPGPQAQASKPLAERLTIRFHECSHLQQLLQPPPRVRGSVLAFQLWNDAVVHLIEVDRKCLTIRVARMQCATAIREIRKSARFLKTFQGQAGKALEERDERRVQELYYAHNVHQLSLVRALCILRGLIRYDNRACQRRKIIRLIAGNAWGRMLARTEPFPFHKPAHRAVDRLTDCLTAMEQIRQGRERRRA